LAIVQTVDFFTPIVDDPFDFGRIAAVNALSDVYAMGAKPLTALNIAAFPIEEYGEELLVRILEGGAAIAREAGVAILGGHTIKDSEPKYGMAVTGTIHPDRIVTNAGARPGDILFLTKPLGTGVLGSALKKDAIDEAAMAEAVRWMTMLSAGPARAMLAVGVHAATDITGFGLLGHAGEVARASGVCLHIHATSVPVMRGVLKLVEAGVVPGGTITNVKEHAVFTGFASGTSETLRIVLSDAQTSGGLLIAVPPDRAGTLRRALLETGSLGAEIGFVTAGQGLEVK
jgi:selenide,water dikinase